MALNAALLSGMLLGAAALCAAEASAPSPACAGYEAAVLPAESAPLDADKSKTGKDAKKKTKSKTENSKAEKSKTEKSKADKPQADKPKSEKPKTEKLKTEKPKPDAVKPDKAETEKPKTEPPPDGQGATKNTGFSFTTIVVAGLLSFAAGAGGLFYFFQSRGITIKPSVAEPKALPAMATEAIVIESALMRSADEILPSELAAITLKETPHLPAKEAALKEMPAAFAKPALNSLQETVPPVAEKMPTAVPSSLPIAAEKRDSSVDESGLLLDPTDEEPDRAIEAKLFDKLIEQSSQTQSAQPADLSDDLVSPDSADEPAAPAASTAIPIAPPATAASPLAANTGDALTPFDKLRNDEAPDEDTLLGDTPDDEALLDNILLDDTLLDEQSVNESQASHAALNDLAFSHSLNDESPQAALSEDSLLDDNLPDDSLVDDNLLSDSMVDAALLDAAPPLAALYNKAQTPAAHRAFSEKMVACAMENAEEILVKHHPETPVFIADTGGQFLIARDPLDAVVSEDRHELFIEHAFPILDTEAQARLLPAFKLLYGADLDTAFHIRTPAVVARHGDTWLLAAKGEILLRS